MPFDPNPLFFEMCRIFSENYDGNDKLIIANEGGSRSSKTWDTFHFIYTFCDHNRNKGNDIYILRDTLTNCRDYTFKDFKKCMEVIDTDFRYMSEGQKPYLNMFGNNVFFRGTDSEENTEGYPSDILFVNEALETDRSKIEGLKMRCRKLIILDWNPKFTDHWCFDLEGQDNVFFTRTNYKNNKHLQKSIINDIEGYEPWEPGSYYIENNTIMFQGAEVTDRNQPPPNLKNIKAGTANEFRWKVYGLGLRGAMKGVVFDNVRWIDKFPDIGFTYANDFGFTADPNCFGKYGETETDIFVEPLIYEPIETPEILAATLEALGVDRSVPIACDSSDKYTGENKGTVEMVAGIRSMGFPEAFKISKTKSIMFWILSMKNKRINIVKNHLYRHIKKEKENYRFKEINGITINQPIDSYNHFWDMARYGHISHNSSVSLETDWA